MSNNLPSDPSSRDLSLAVPDFMREDGNMGTEQLAKFVQPPRLLVVQALSGAPLNKYESGTVLLLPEERVVLGYSKGQTASNGHFLFTPLFFFNEYVVANPRSIAKSHGSVRERTFDDNSDIARRAMSRDKSVREFPCPEALDKMCKYMVRMNYLLWLYANEGEAPYNAPCLLTLKSTGSTAARVLNSMIQARRTAVFGNIFAASTAARSNNEGAWHGFEFSNPPVGSPSFVEDKSTYDMFKQAHLDAKSAFEQQLFNTDDIDDETEASTNVDF